MSGLGYTRLWRWFGLSRASWLTLPRVLMHEMPDPWQDRMAELLEEFGREFPNMKPSRTRVNAVENGKLVQMPEAISNYRLPDEDYISACRGNTDELVKMKGDM